MLWQWVALELLRKNPELNKDLIEKVESLPSDIAADHYALSHIITKDLGLRFRLFVLQEQFEKACNTCDLIREIRNLHRHDLSHVPCDYDWERCGLKQASTAWKISKALEGDEDEDKGDRRKGKLENRNKSRKRSNVVTPRSFKGKRK